MLNLLRRRRADDTETDVQELLDAPGNDPADDDESAEQNPAPAPRGRKGRSREADVGHPWTNGQRLLSGATTTLVFAALLSGPAALGLRLLEDEAAPVSVAAEVQDPSRSQHVAEFAAGFMTAYLSSSRGQEEALLELMASGAGGDLRLPAEPPEITAVTAGQSIQLDEDSWIVTVAVDTPGGEEQPSVRRYWQVPILAGEDGSIAVSALPSLVAAPDGGELRAEEGQDVRDEGLRDTATAFVAAYLAGQGEVAPLTVPDVELGAITPVPYTEVSVGAMTTHQELPEAPAEGDVVRTQISVTATAEDGSTVQLEYTLELRYRDRWEVSAVNPTTENPAPEGDPS